MPFADMHVVAFLTLQFGGRPQNHLYLQQYWSFELRKVELGYILSFLDKILAR
jgi:hypothetical protein